MQAIESLKRVLETQPMAPVERERLKHALRTLERWRDYGQVIHGKTIPR